MEFLELVDKVNNISDFTRDNIKNIVKNISIDNNNFDKWVDDIFSDKIFNFDMGKLPYILDELYQTNDKYLFNLFCMLLESSCMELKFISNLEDYNIYKEKFKALTSTLVTVYERVNNGIANCMSLIIINNDPKFLYFNEELKSRLIEATKEKLNAIYSYLKSENIDYSVFEDLEIIIDMACYLNSEEINDIVNRLDDLMYLESAEPL